MKRIFFVLSVFSLTLSTFFSCSSSKDEPSSSSIVDKTSVLIMGASSSNFNVTASGDWSIVIPKTDWLTVTPTSGSGKTAITCTATIPNAYREKRQTNLPIFSTGDSYSVVAVKDSLPNTAPTAPASALYPANGATGVNESVINLRWEPAVDPEGDRVYYNLQTSADGTTWTTIAPNLSVPFYSSGTKLTANTKYYWRVQAVDLFGALSSYSAAFSYTTATNASAWTDGEVRLYQNCINSTASDPFTLIVTGDGFTASDMTAGGNWDTWSNKAIQGLLGNIEPYKTWGNYLRIIRLAAISQESGISQHELSGDTDGKCAVRVNTKFGTYYDNSSSTFCGLYDNTPYADGGTASKAQDWVIAKLKASGYNITKNYAILFILNVSHYNGTVFYIPDDPASVQNPCTMGYVCLSPGSIGSQTGFENVVCHEIGGHAIGHLADLYTRAGALSDAKKQQSLGFQSIGWYQNISLIENKTQSPWNFFFTDANIKDHDKYYPLVDLFAGARSATTGIWRPQSGATCMNDNRFEYDAPSRYSIIKQLKTCVGETLTWADFVNKDYDRNNTNVTKAFKLVPGAQLLHEPIVLKLHRK